MPGEGQLGRRSVDARARRVRRGLRHIDEYRFAVTQLGGYPLSLGEFGVAGVHDAERVAEVAVLVGENAQHCHVDGHVADATGWADSAPHLALRSSAPIASRTASNMPTDPEIAPSLMPRRSRPRRYSGSSSSKPVESMNGW